jgi:aminoglycoside phosphotransferase (APT) family kinase protein
LADVVATNSSSETTAWTGWMGAVESEDDWRRLIGAWGPDAEVLDMLGGGLGGDVRQVRVEQRMAVGRLSGRSRASLDWELHLLHELAGAGVRVPAIIATASGARRNDHMVITEWIPARGVTPDDAARRARYLHRVHELTAEWSQRPGSRTARELLTMENGGDISMALLPGEVAAACRLAWDALPAGPLCAVHGDIDPENCLVAYDGEVVMIDWDKSRMDHPWFDLASLPMEASGLTEKQYRVARRASCAWEVAVHWPTNEIYARQRLRELQRLV